MLNRCFGLVLLVLFLVASFVAGQQTCMFKCKEVTFSLQAKKGTCYHYSMAHCDAANIWALNPKGGTCTIILPVESIARSTCTHCKATCSKPYPYPEEATGKEKDCDFKDTIYRSKCVIK